MKNENSKRTSGFSRNILLEELLNEINTSLWEAEKVLIPVCKQPTLPVIFIMGSARSGTTLLIQWLANTGIVSYPSNLLSRFYNAPVLGAKIQLMLTDPRYNFRNELGEFSQSLSYNSENGKTSGALAPNEFWYFWRRFLANPEHDHHSDEVLRGSMDSQTMLSELAGLTDVFNKPFACKGMLFNYNIEYISSIIKNAIFIHINREPVFNMQSILEARKRQFGSREKWYSFKIKEYSELSKNDPVTQVAGQVFYINKAITRGLAKVSCLKKITTGYSSFCLNPESLYAEIVNKLSGLGYTVSANYSGPESFKLSETWKGSDGEAQEFTKAYDYFVNTS